MFLMISSILTAQDRYLTKNGEASFFSEAPLENIEATNQQVLGIIDVTSQQIAISLLMKSFQFEKALMQEHFNENYVESDKYPKAKFKGVFSSTNKIDFASNNVYEVDIMGDLTIHGVTKSVNTKGVISLNDNVLVARSKFKIKVDDFDIEVPKAVNKNIAEEIEISIDLACNPMEVSSQRLNGR